MKRWLKRLLKIVLAIFALFVAFLIVERVRGKISLARYKRELIAEGMTLDPQAFAARVETNDSCAPQVYEGIYHLRKGAVLPTSRPPSMTITPSNHAIVGFSEREWIEGELESRGRATNNWAGVAADLKTNESALAGIRAALGKPVLNSRWDYSLAPNIPFTNLASAKSLCYWFGAESQLALSEGRNHDALESLLAVIQLPRLLEQDRLLISELVRYSMASIARSQTWEALQADGWTDADLARLQEAWKGRSFCETMTQALEGELVFENRIYEVMRHSHETAAMVLFGLEYLLQDKEAGFWEKQVYCRVWQFTWLDQDEVRCLRKIRSLMEISRRAAAGKSFADIQSAIEGLENEFQNKNFYDRWRYPTAEFSFMSLGNCLNRAMRTETERSLTVCSIALKRYTLRHGSLPATLETLVPEFLPSVPIDYMDGKPAKYHRNSDGTFSLYSVGEDGKDDGGNVSPMPGKEHSRLPWARKDFVWPQPASPEEVEAYRREEAKN